MSNEIILLESLIEDIKTERAPEMSKDDFFEIFVNEQILKEYEASYEEIATGIVDSGGDGGIDGIHVFINGELLREDTDLNVYKREIKIDVFIVQSKNQRGFHEDAILKLVTSTSELFDLSIQIDNLSMRYNKELLKIIKMFREAYKKLVSKFPVLNFYYYYATKAEEVHPNVEGRVELLQQEVKIKFSDSNFKFEFLTARKLLELARKRVSTCYELKFSHVISTDDFGYMGLIPLKDYYAFITDDKNRILKSLFDANVRDYQGSVAVNTSIKETLMNQIDKQDFWWLNNGITITVNKATMAGNVLTMEEPQVVNGCQTSFETYSYIKGLDEEQLQNETRKVLVKVIQVPNEEIGMNIIKASNSQTQIPLGSLRATDSIHRDIEEYLKAQGWYYERRKNFYKNMGKPISNIISVGYLSQAIEAIILQKPDISRARPSTLLKKDDDYKKIFDTKFSLQLYLNVIKVVKRIEEHLKNSGTQAGDILNLKYHTAMFMIQYHLRQTHSSWKKIQELNVNEISIEEIEFSIQTVKTIYEELGGNDKVAKGSKYTEEVRGKLNEILSVQEQQISLEEL